MPKETRFKSSVVWHTAFYGVRNRVNCRNLGLIQILHACQTRQGRRQGFKDTIRKKERPNLSHVWISYESFIPERTIIGGAEKEDS